MDNVTERDIIDDEIEEVFQIASHQETILIILEISVYIVLLTALISDVVLVYTISVNKLLRTKPYLILTAWSVCNAYLLIRIFLEILFNITATNSDKAFFVLQFDFIILFNQIIFMFVLLFTKLSESRSVKLKYIFLTIVSVNLIQFSTLFFLNVFTWPFVNLIVLFVTLSVTLLALLCKEFLIFCCKKNSSESTALFRLGVVRIFVYNLTLVFQANFVLSYFGLRYGEAVFLSILLTSFYILMYLIKFDAHFKLCFLSLFKRSVLKYNVVASLAVNGEDSVTLNV